MIFGEQALSFYRYMTTMIFKDNVKGTIFFKNIVYAVALFFAKKKGSLLVFFTEQEKFFESLHEYEQYQIFLKNSELNTYKSNEENESSFSFDLVFNITKNVEIIENIIECLNLQQFKNLTTFFVISEHNSKKIEKVLEKTNISYSIILKETHKTIQKQFNEIIANTKSDYIIFLKDEIIHKNFLNHFNDEIIKSHGDIIYCDEDCVDVDGSKIKPILKPNWSPQLLLSKNYIGSAIFSTILLKKIRGFNEELSDNYEYDLLLRATDNAKKIIHIPIILLSTLEKFKEKNTFSNVEILQNFLKRKQILVEVHADEKEYCHIKQKFDSHSPLISIIIPTKNNEELLTRCISSIKKSTYQNYEILIINNGSNLKFDDVKCTVIPYSKPFNFSKINNFGVKYAKGDHILFLNDDVEVINEDWMEYLLFYSMQKNVGAVGSLLLYPKSRFYSTSIQHGGVTLGVSGPATHSFAYTHYASHNYLNLDKVARNVSALTAACIMIKKETFDIIDGFDPKFVIAFGDIDICLRIKEKGLQIVYCPNSKLYHAESATRGRKHPLSDELEMYDKWEDQIIKGDEFYNPNQTHVNRNFRISTHPSTVTAISVLKEIFYLRKDLQKKIPDYNNNLNQMIDWAAIDGVTKDIARNILVPYNKFYLNNSSKKIKETAIAIYRFNHSQKLQNNFPDVFRGKYINLLSYIRNSAS